MVYRRELIFLVLANMDLAISMALSLGGQFVEEVHTKTNKLTKTKNLMYLNLKSVQDR
jgi:hypothetical protein